MALDLLLDGIIFEHSSEGKAQWIAHGVEHRDQNRNRRSVSAEVDEHAVTEL